jgi:hypothetical protein
MVMDYEHGESLKAFVRAHPRASEARLKALIAPLLDGLEKVHAAGFLHRDIKPDNIFLRQDTGPVLIDFGSARQTAGDPGQALTTIVSPGYAPFEQYTTSKQQGPWSDIYSLGGVLYFVVTGHSPPDAITRMKGDTLGERLGEVRERYSPAFLEAITWSLALEESARPRDVATWRNALLGAAIRQRQSASPVRETMRVEPWVSTIVLEADAAATVQLPVPEPTILLLDAAAAPAVQASSPTQGSRRWEWLFGHPLLIGVTATLGALLGKLPAFQETQMMEGRLSAATLAELLGAGGAILFLWLFGRGIALRLRAKGGPRSVLYDLLMPVVTLASLTIAYAAALRLLGPALDETQLLACAWGFLLGACACAVWLCMAVFSHAVPLRTLLHGYRPAARTGDQGGSA